MRQRITWLAVLVVLSLTAASGWASTVHGQFERTLKVTGPVSLDITTGSGDITVRAGDSSTVEIRGKISVNWQLVGGAPNADARVREIEQHPPIEQDGNHIHIGPLPEDLGRNISIDYELMVPQQTELTSKSGSGDLSIEGIRGPVNARSGSGDMKVRSIGGDVTVKTGSGDIKLEEVSQGHVEVETGSGDMELRGINGALHARTGSGDIVADGKLAGDWVLRAGSGEVTVHLPPETGFNLEAHTSSGDISTGSLPVTVVGTIGHGSLRGQVRGGGPRVEVQTGSGDIHID